jgi:hypothetical protein
MIKMHGNRSFNERLASGLQSGNTNDGGIIPFSRGYSPDLECFMEPCETGSHDVYSYRSPTGIDMMYAVAVSSSTEDCYTLYVHCISVEDGYVAVDPDTFAPPYPLFSLDNICAFPDADILLVRDEPSVEQFQPIFPGHVISTFPRVTNLAAVDFSPLEGRHVEVVAGNISFDSEYAKELENHLSSLGLLSVTLLPPPPQN